MTVVMVSNCDEEGADVTEGAAVISDVTVGTSISDLFEVFAETI